MPETDLASFRRAGHAAARSAGSGAGLRVLDTGLAFFDAVDIAGTAVLAHRRLPVVAFSAAVLQPGSAVREFIASPPWSGPFADAGLRLPAPAEPDAPIDRVDLSAPARAELTAARYRGPQTLGEPMLNWWDRPSRRPAETPPPRP
ncbi:hypothetical protein [Streptomyces fodineus]|uniref:hypothetical protein n=1 Tax=Streptomyces fodineus TaxID=1904616 RepID=UPI00131CDCCB|nr:hypothetical protein [Streptomyces fodineus]